MRELVTLHGGEINVASEPGRGSAFTVRVPFGTAHLASGRIRASRAAAPTAVRANPYIGEALRWLTPGLPSGKDAGPEKARLEPRPGGRVLLADDNPDMRAYVTRLLGTAGFVVEAVADGEAALAAARTSPPDLVLADLMMPRLDGFGLLDAIRADPALRDTPVVLLSARAGEEARAEGIEAGADDYLTKPFSARELVARVSANLELARGRREAALRENEARFRLLADAVPAIVWVTDADGRVEFFNRQWFDYTGVECDPTSADQVAKDFIHPDDGERTMAAFGEARRTGTTFLMEHRIRSAAGDYRWFLVRGEPHRDAVTGEVVRWFGASVDIHDRKLADEALRESEARYRTLFQALDAGFCIVEMLFEGERAVDYRFIEVNPAFSAQTGLLHATGKRMRELAPAHEEHWFEIYGRVAKTGEPVRFENEAAVLGRFYDVHAFRIGPPEDNRVAILFADISERRRAELALWELNDTLEQRVAERTAALSGSQRRFQGIFDSAFQFMALLSPDGTVVEVNRTALAWSQIAPADIVGRPFWLAAPMRDNLALQAAVKAGIRRAATGETVREEHEMRGAGDIRAIVDFSLKPVPSDHGEPVWLVAEGRDITQLKEAQEALRQAQKMEAMGQLTGGVAHDFNNLLTPIMGALDMLQRKGLGGEREQRLISGAMQSADRAKTLVQRLLSFARRQPLQPTAVDLRQLTRAMAELIASTTGPQIKVLVEAPTDLPPANADPNQLEMAILNLAVNARDAMPDGGTLRISADAETVGRQHRSGLKPGRYLCLSVADTGSGMDEATLARAVEPFFSTKGIGKGTGLGLSMVHGLATQLGGALTLRSTPGLGTNVELWLPRGDTLPASAEPAAAEQELPLRRGCVLLVDDEDLVRLTTADMLIELGYTVTEAASAEEALRLLDRGLQPDLLMTDHLMPGMSGTDLARSLRRERPGMKTLVVSGYAETDGIAPDLPRLNKPFRSTDLAERLAALL